MSGEGGIGIVGMLTIIFLVLKLTGVITWSWWWVFAPLWISALLVVGILLIILLVVIVCAIAAAIIN